MRYFTVKNFEQFQRYKDREPTWIMLHRTLLRDFEFAQLPDDTKAHLMLIWLLVSQQKERRLPMDAAWISSQIGARKKVDLDAMIRAGFLVASDDDSRVEEGPAETYGPGSERDLEDSLIEALSAGTSFIGLGAIDESKRQVRIGDSYIDLLIRAGQASYVIELKRCRLSNVALTQLRRYLGLVPGSRGILIGCGLSPTFDISTCDGIGILVYDSHLNWSMPSDGGFLPADAPAILRDITVSRPVNFHDSPIDTVSVPSRAGARSVSGSVSDLGSSSSEDSPADISGNSNHPLSLLSPEDAGTPKSRKKPETPWPDGFELDEDMRTYALKAGIDPDREFERWHNDCLAHDRRYREWRMAWRTRIDNAPRFAGMARGSPNGQPRLVGIDLAKARLAKTIADEEAAKAAGAK